MKYEKFIDAEKALLNCFDYPDFVRPEYLIKQQEQSGWSKSVFLQSMDAMCDAYSEQVRIFTELSKHKEIGLSDSLKKLLERAQKDGTIRANGLDTLESAKKVIDYLRTTITKAWRFNMPKKEYSPAEVIGFAEKAVDFINAEFQMQLKPGPHESRLRPDGFMGRTTNGEKQYLLYNYSIIGDVQLLF